jgi:hypothetical protein
MDGALLRDLAARPRPTGSPAVAAARERCARALRELGYQVAESPFEFSAFPGRFGTPVFGALVMGLVAVAGHWGARGARVFPLVVLVSGGLALTAFGVWLARHGVLRLGVMRATGVNTQASRSRDVRVWLCAHVDTKSQPVPTLVRAVGIGIETAGAAATLLLAAGAAMGIHAAYAVWATAAGVTLAGSIPVVLSVVGDRSPGALDNASGVATVLSAARELRDLEGIGVLLTDAEELGLAGAHAWSTGRASTVVLNCDGVDDSGDVTVMLPRRHSSSLRGVIAAASREAGVAHRARGIPVGLLTDSVAFAQHGLASATFSRGSWSSLARVHSAGDNLSRLTGRGIPDVARLMAQTARLLASRTSTT